MSDDERGEHSGLRMLFRASVTRRGAARVIAAATAALSISPADSGAALVGRTAGSAHDPPLIPADRSTHGASVIDVRSFGARCDAAADDTFAIRRAIAALPPAGGTIYFPGLCRTTGAIDARDRSNVQFQGDSPELTGIYLDVSDDTVPCVAVGQAVSRHGTHSVYDVRFRDLCLRNSRTPGHGVGVAIFDAARVTFDRCHIGFLRDGIAAQPGRWLSQLAVRDCVIERCSGVGIRCDGDEDARTLFGVDVRGCRIVQNGSHGILFRYGSDLFVSGASSIARNRGDGIRVIGSARRPVRCQSIRIEHADIDSNWGYNIYFYEVEQSTITTLWSGGSGGQGVPRSGPDNVPENAIADRAGIYLENCRTTSILGTTTANNSLHGIHLHNCQGVTVIGTQAMSNGHARHGAPTGGAGIFVEGAAHSFVSLIGCDCTGVAGDERQDYGILIDSSCREDVNIVGCSAFNSSTRDLRSDATGATVRCIGCDFGTTSGVATVTSSRQGQILEDSTTGRHYVAYAHGAPTSGRWRAGDRVYDAAPVAGGALGWVCVSGGSPGVWKRFGFVEA